MLHIEVCVCGGGVIFQPSSLPSGPNINAHLTCQIYPPSQQPQNSQPIKVPAKVQNVIETSLAPNVPISPAKSPESGRDETLGRIHLGKILSLWRPVKPASKEWLGRPRKTTTDIPVLKGTV